MNFNLKLTLKSFPLWIFLWGISCIYRMLLLCRNQLYQFQIISQFQSKKTVISIGNITVGGTGKSPVVSSVLSFLEQNNLPTAVLTRGYGRKIKTDPVILNQANRSKLDILECGDEPWMLFLNHTQTSFYISANRSKIAQLAEVQADVLIMDDGMQHIRLKRDLDICLVDAVNGFGNGYLLPLGPLRESFDKINRADAIIITKTNLASQTIVEEALKTNLKNKIPIFIAKFCPIFLKGNHPTETISVEALNGKNCVLISGIGNPKGFEKTIRSLNGNILNHFIFQDHYQFDEKDLTNLEKEISHKNVDYLITTEKDFVKLSHYKQSVSKLYYVKMEMLIEDNFFCFLVDFLNNRGMKLE